MRKDKRITINVDEDLYNVLLNISLKWHKSISYVILKILENTFKGGDLK